MHHADTHDRSCPAYVLTRRPAPRRHGGLLLAITAMAACSMTGLHGGTHRSGTQEPSSRSPGSGVIELASVRVPLLAPLLPVRPAARTAPPDRTPAADRHWARPIGFTAATGDTRIPVTALAAYQHAAVERAAVDPACRLPWTLLAGIGKVESDHAGGGRLAPDGTASTPILGPELNGRGVAALPDPDASPPGSAWLRAVGPMQLLPTTWKEWAVPARPDTPPDPENIFDAAATAGAYLCDEHRDLADPQQLSQAVLAYNPSAEYLFDVLSWVVAYSSADAQLGTDEGWFAPVPKAAERTGKSTAPAVARPASGAKPPDRTTATATTAPPAPPAPSAPPVPSPRPEVPPGTSSPAPTATPAPTMPTVPTTRPSAGPSPTTAPTAPPPSALPSPTAKPSVPGQGDSPAPSRTPVPGPSPTRAG